MTRRALFAVLVLLVIPFVGSIGEDEGKEWVEVAESSNKFESKFDYFEDSQELQSNDSGEVVIVTVESTNLRFSPE